MARFLVENMFSKMKKTDYFAPIAFFAYKRPEHTKRALESLAQNIGAENSELYIFCDGPKSNSDYPKIAEVRGVVNSNQWCGTVNIVENNDNVGLANSVIAGVSELCKKYGRVIVLEDDLILSPFFLKYMNSALDVYQNDDEVMQISGYMFPVEGKGNGDTLFLPITTSWGWATWQNAWSIFDSNLSQFSRFSTDPTSVRRFDLNNSYPFFAMLKKQISGEIDSWAIKWYFSIFMKNGLVLYPKWSLVENIGNDGSGTHCTTKVFNENAIYKESIQVVEHISKKTCPESLKNIQKFLSEDNNSLDLLYKRTIKRIKNLLSEGLVGR